MYYAASLFIAAAITFFLVSHIARMLHAKRPDIAWIFVASLVGGVLAFITFVLLKIFIIGIDPMITLFVSLIVALIVSSAAFKSINQMSWGSAITTSIANVAIGLIAVVAAVVLNGESVKNTFQLVSKVAQKNASVVEYVATGEETEVADEQLEDEDGLVESEEELEPVITQLDFLPPGAAIEKAKKDKRSYVEPKYHVISINRISSAVGKAIRIKRKNGSEVSGLLVKLLGNDVVITQRLAGGTATTPVSIATIKKLEVYR